MAGSAKYFRYICFWNGLFGIFLDRNPKRSTKRQIYGFLLTVIPLIEFMRKAYELLSNHTFYLGHSTTAMLFLFHLVFYINIAISSIFMNLKKGNIQRTIFLIKDLDLSPGCFNERLNYVAAKKTFSYYLVFPIIASIAGFSTQLVFIQVYFNIYESRDEYNVTTGIYSMTRNNETFSENLREAKRYWFISSSLQLFLALKKISHNALIIFAIIATTYHIKRLRHLSLFMKQKKCFKPDFIKSWLQFQQKLSR
jgi:hypothetical protein